MSSQTWKFYSVFSFLSCFISQNKINVFGLFFNKKGPKYTILDLVGRFLTLLLDEKVELVDS